MKKYSKKIALILVLALTLAIAVPVLAAQQTIVTGAYEDPVIDVTITATGEVGAVINPYALPWAVQTDNGTELASKLKNSQVVVAKPLAAYSMSEVDLKVGAKVLGEVVGDEFRLASEKPESDSTMKSGLVYLEMKTVDDLGYSNTPDASLCIGDLEGSKIVAALNDWAREPYMESKANQLLVGTREVSKTGMCTLKAAVDASGNKLTAPATTGGYMVARLSGDMVKAPTIPWKATDGVKVTITWIFEPATTN